ncbi:MAG TPA: hypothetical protein VK174_11390 [Chitinophagales bacterium]|nr:hypothetical protein [Chitinophagales bacterium]HLP49597.1 hypothetical protein [Chitinophagales bacterium]
MKKRKMRVYSTFVEAHGKYNNEIFCPVQDGYKLLLAICTNCGELFVIDMENPLTCNLTVRDIAKHSLCPQCNSPLFATLERYPETFVTKDNQVGHYVTQSYIPTDDETKIIEAWEILPE